MLATALATALLVIVSFQSAYGDRKSSRELESALFANYSLKWRPAMMRSQKTIVSVGLYMRDLNDVDEKQHTVTIHGGLHMFWNDYRLRWDTSQYDSWYITTSPWRVWKPDWTAYNSFQPSGRPSSVMMTPYTYNQAWIYYDGTVSYYSALTKTVTCAFDYSNFPFDTQRCSFFFGSWMYPYSQIDFQWAKAKSLNLNLEWLGSPMNRSRTSGWRLKEVLLKKHYFYDDNSYVDDPPPPTYDPANLWPLLAAEFVLERHRPYFALLELTPMLMTSFLTLMSFGIDSEIVSIGVLFASLIAQGLCSWSIVDQLPTGGTGSTPKIVHAFGVCFGLTCATLLLHLALQRVRMLNKSSPIVVFVTSLTSKPWMSGFRAVNALKINSFGTDYQEIIDLTNELEAVRGANVDQQIDNAIWTIKKAFFLVFTLTFVIAFPATLL